MPRTATGNGLGEFPAGRRHQPIVARADATTAKRLGLTLPQLLEVAATLERWGSHADGSDVFRFRDMLQATGQAPPAGETPSHRGSRNANRNRKAAQAR